MTVKKTIARDRRVGVRDRRVAMLSTDHEFIEALRIVLNHPEAADRFYTTLAERIQERSRSESGGETVYVAKKGSIDDKARRNVKIIAKFNGSNFAELSKDFNLTTRRIRDICNKK
ncbi:MAG: hypothetical protein A2143_01815 [Gallionellales bacterium RBG_16_57_15]|nr:MAG: hypothetical protein A2143_01815 [Gallionellales bacterium RBG_16_57_15]